MKILKLLLCFFTIATAAGCATRSNFHDLALIREQPPEAQKLLTIPFDAYIVGIEKDNSSRIGRIAECGQDGINKNCLDINSSYFMAHQDIRNNLQGKYLGQHRPTFVSHIARFDSSGNVCFLYNVYNSAGSCDSRVVAVAGMSLVDDSWLALKQLGDELQQYVAKNNPTHIIVYTMGWNTLQPEALGNIRELGGRLKRAAIAAGDVKFKPLMIGVTWPSTGKPIISSSDFGIKAKDADEVGAVWENILLNRELARLKSNANFKLVVIGHSFGARVTSRAVFSAPLVSKDDGKVVDLLIGLQGAYSVNRFFGGDDPEGKEGAPYRDFDTRVGMIALTSSVYDTAVTSAGHADYFIGSDAVYKKTKSSPYAEKFIHTTADAAGRIDKPACDIKKILYMDSSSIIKTPSGTASGAHSDIYTDEIGSLVYELIQTCAS